MKKILLILPFLLLTIGNQTLYAQADCASSKDCFTAAFDLDDANQRVEMFNKAISLWADGDGEDNLSTIYVNRGIELNGLGQKEAAIADLKKAFELFPSNGEAYTNLGNLYAIDGNIDEAMKYFSLSIENDSTYVNAYFFRGFSYYNREEMALAFSDFGTAQKLIPINGYRDGVYYLQTGDTNVSPQMKANIHYYHGYISYWYMDDAQGAFNDASYAIKENPNHAESYLLRGNIFTYVGQQYDNAIMDYDAYVNLRGENREICYSKGIAFYYKEDYANAVMEFNKAVNFISNDYFSLFYRGMSKWYSKQYSSEEIVADLKLAIDNGPDSSIAIDARKYLQEYFNTTY